MVRCLMASVGYSNYGFEDLTKMRSFLTRGGVDLTVSMFIVLVTECFYSNANEIKLRIFSL